MKRFIEAADREQSTLPECLDDWIACGKEMRLASVVPIAKDRVFLLPARQRTPAQNRECRQEISGDAVRRLMVAGRWLRAMPAIRNMSPVRAFLTGSVFAVSATLPFAEAEQRQANGPHFAFHLVQELYTVKSGNWPVFVRFCTIGPWTNEADSQDRP
jgi:hypothetical protein